MPGLQSEHVGSPIKRSKLSLKFFQKTETKRALDFSEPQADDANCDQVVPAPSLLPSSPDDLPLSCRRLEDTLPFVGLLNEGNTCYLNSILQVLYHCPGLKEGIKSLYKLSTKNATSTEETKQCEEVSTHPAGDAAEDVSAHMELLESFHSLISSVEQLQSNFLLSTDSFNELNTSPRKVLNTLRQLNPMYEGYLQHDAQEVLQCILEYIQEACNTIRKEHKPTQAELGSGSMAESQKGQDEDAQVSGKRKSDAEMGNAKKKPKSRKSGAEVERLFSTPVTRSKSKLAHDNTMGKAGEKEETKEGKEKEGGSGEEKTFQVADRKKKKRRKMGWRRPAKKQPSIMSMFRTVGKLTSTFAKISTKTENDNDEVQPKDEKKYEGVMLPNENQVHKTPAHQGASADGLDLMERLFHGQLVLRTRCLECESFTERREDFQDISVPVLEEQPGSPDHLSSVSPYPKPEEKTLKWAIGQFASVERIAGEDKYFCDACRHYAEAERSLLFDQTPEVVTIHLKRFSASGLEMEPYACLSKVTTPLQTPLTLSLEEWCTPRSSSGGHSYKLFAVVMHSGVSIGSGHYTAYIHMSDLKDAELRLRESQQLPETKDAWDDSDGEVSVGRPSGSACGKAQSKKAPECGLGLLGGQRSRTGVEQEERATDGDKPKRRKTQKPNAEVQLEAGEKSGTTSSEEEQGWKEQAWKEQALNNLLQYEGKWLLFDDSEVRLFEEKDVLRACCLQTCSSSTPYLLFYKRVVESAH
ncbi:ubiquitin carboxyl-terminal hydrolase 1 isoform X2 [Syngnathus acus]|uniref:ubiquitin carboxyl-terminal hydrolase 1 isoform X2 n=1 Tax=Syngnathus acus TaxID=161584 RepID=UPI0018861DE7|nr:ubiquitin carboxyl-terminal hydrolase 1 isoform X2 [Syngnathus acus]